MSDDPRGKVESSSFDLKRDQNEVDWFDISAQSRMGGPWTAWVVFANAILEADRQWREQEAIDAE